MRFAAFVVTLLMSLPVLAQKQVIVVDSEGKSVAAIDLTTGAVAQSVALPFTPDRALLSPDDATLLALYRGPGSMGFWVAEFRPTGKSQAAVVREGKVVGQTELGWGLADSVFSNDGKSAYVLTTGYESNKTAERKPSELIRIDTATGQVSNRLQLDAAAEAFASDPSGTKGIIYSPPYPKKKPAPLPARVTFIDLATMKPLGAVDLPGTVRRKPAAVGDMLYVVDSGTGAGGGKVYVVDIEKGAIAATLNVGAEASLTGSDRDGRVYVVSRGEAKNGGRVTVIQGEAVVNDYIGPSNPTMARLSPDGRKLFVIGSHEFSVIDLASGKAGEPMTVASGAFAVLGSAAGDRTFIVSLDGTSCCRISTFDMNNHTRLTTFLGGSKGERIGQGLAAAALTIASYEAGSSAARSSGSSSFYYTIYSPVVRGAARGPLAFGPGEKKVYLADTQTNDVTVVDAATGERITNIDASSGLREVVPMHDAGVVAAIADKAVTFVDTATDTVRSKIDLAGDVAGALMTPDEKSLVVFGKERVVVIDAATAREVATIKSLKHPVQVLFPER